MLAIVLSRLPRPAGSSRDRATGEVGETDGPKADAGGNRSARSEAAEDRRVRRARLARRGRLGSGRTRPRLLIDREEPASAGTGEGRDLPTSWPDGAQR